MINSTSTNSNQSVTMCNRYDGGVKEFIFSIKNRPFGMIISPNLPVPNTSLLDFDLVQKLSLPINDRQYKKFTYNGCKMRIVGRVSTTAQCLQSGTLSGNIHVKAFVVLDLHTKLDVDSVAGSTMAVKLGGSDVTTPAKSPMATGSSCQLPSIREAAGDDTTTPPAASDGTTTPPDVTDTTTPSDAGNVNVEPTAARSTSGGCIALGGRDDVPTEAAGGRDDAYPEAAGGPDDDCPEAVGGRNDCPSLCSKGSSVTPTTASVMLAKAAAAHARLIVKSECRRTRAELRDNRDLTPDLHHHVRAIADTASLSPHAANLSMLDAMFGKADIKVHPEEQIQVLLDVDGDGDLDESPDGVNFTFIKYDGLRYKPGHGRMICSSDCSLKRNPPHNCGYHRDWIFPIDFSPCSSRCRGAFCKCIRGGTFSF